MRAPTVVGFAFIIRWPVPISCDLRPFPHGRLVVLQLVAVVPRAAASIGGHLAAAAAAAAAAVAAPPLGPANTKQKRISPRFKPATAPLPPHPPPPLLPTLSVTLVLSSAQAAAPVPLPKDFFVAVAAPPSVAVAAKVLAATAPAAPAAAVAVAAAAVFAAERILATPGVVLVVVVVCVSVRVVAVVAFGAGGVANVPHHAAGAWGNRTKNEVYTAAQRRNKSIDRTVTLLRKNGRRETAAGGAGTYENGKCPPPPRWGAHICIRKLRPPAKRNKYTFTSAQVPERSP